MRFALKTIVALFLLLSIGMGSWFIYGKLIVKKNAINNLKRFPNLKLTSLDNLPIFASDLIQPNKATIICLFNSECDHCNQQIKEIKTLISSNDVNVILISSESLSRIRSYTSVNNLNNSKMHFTSIDEGEVFESFGAISFPHLLIYNSQGELKKEFMGEVKAEAILKHVTE
ncbi:MAG: peroxiredoxin family protein [Flammeovirgaceae bacterium]